MKKRRPLFATICIFLCLVMLFSCTEEKLPSDDKDGGEGQSKYTGELSFSGRSYSYRGEAHCISVKDDVVTVIRSGRYLISGKLTEGRIAVDTEGETVLVLNGVELSSSYGSVIYAEGTSELIIESAENTVNLISCKNGDSSDGFAPDACVFSEGFLTFRGDGKTVVSSRRGAGITSLGEIRIKNTNLTVSAVDYGLWSRDLVLLDGGRLTISRGSTGIFSGVFSGALGRVEIKNGVFTALCQEIAIAAGREISVVGGSASIDAPKIYECGFVDGQKKIVGKIEIKSDGFPSG